MKGKCLVIADDLTGGADTGARFASCGLRTLMVSLRRGGGTVDCAAFPDWEVLVVNTDSRGAPPQQAFQVVSQLLASYSKDLYPLIYKKIDSTLRGNIGSEIDAILGVTEIPLAFFTPSFPEQSRAVVGGILIVNGSPLALADVSRRRSSESDSHVQTILSQQSSHPSAIIDLHQVAMGNASLREAIERERRSGARILIFDALRRRDLEHVAAAAFQLDEQPLFVGSAGLAGEVAKCLEGSKPWDDAALSPGNLKTFPRVIIICGSRSGVTHQQIAGVESTGAVTSFELDEQAIQAGEKDLQEHVTTLSGQIATTLARGHVLLKSCHSVIDVAGVSKTITETLGKIAGTVFASFPREKERLALVITGGATASSVFGALGVQGLEILGEVVDGIAFGRLVGGQCHGLTVVTKAGGFGDHNCFVNLVKTLEEGIPHARSA